MSGTSWINEIVYDIHHDEESELNTESKQVTDDIGNGHNQPGEVYLAKDAGVLNKSI